MRSYIVFGGVSNEREVRGLGGWVADSLWPSRGAFRGKEI